MLISTSRKLRSYRVPMSVFVLLSLSACANNGLFGSKDESTVLKRDGLDVILDDSSKQAFIFKDPHGVEKYCRSPSPDFAVTASQGVSVGIGLPGTSQKGVGEDSSQGALALGGRNPEVLVARELMYRACELSLNINADPQTTRNIYTEFLAAIERIAKSQTGQGDAPLAATPADARLNNPGNSKNTASSSNNTIQSNNNQNNNNSGNSSGGVTYSN